MNQAEKMMDAYRDMLAYAESAVTRNAAGTRHQADGGGGGGGGSSSRAGILNACLMRGSGGWLLGPSCRAGRPAAQPRARCALRGRAHPLPRPRPRPPLACREENQQPAGLGERGHGHGAAAGVLRGHTQGGAGKQAGEGGGGSCPPASSSCGTPHPPPPTSPPAGGDDITVPPVAAPDPLLCQTQPHSR